MTLVVKAPDGREIYVPQQNCAKLEAYCYELQQRRPKLSLDDYLKKRAAKADTLALKPLQVKLHQRLERKIAKSPIGKKRLK